MRYNIRMNRKRVYAVHVARVGFTSMTEYAKWKAGPDPAPAGEFFIFYRQDAAGRATVRQYLIRYARYYGLLDRLTDRYQYEYDPSRHTYKIEPFRPNMRRWRPGSDCDDDDSDAADYSYTPDDE